MAMTTEQAKQFEMIVRSQTAVCVAIVTLGAGKTIPANLVNSAQKAIDGIRALNKEVHINPKGKAD